MLKLPLVDPKFVFGSDFRGFAPDREPREVFHSYSRGLCPQCRKTVDGVRILRGGKVYLRKQCPTHGQSEALISGDVEWFLKSLTYIKEGSVPIQYSTEVKHGCPDDCGDG